MKPENQFLRRDARLVRPLLIRRLQPDARAVRPYFSLKHAVLQHPLLLPAMNLRAGYYEPWLGQSGLDMYDNTARLHDPLLMRFASPDPLYAKFGWLSPWSHCAADPLNIIDPTGFANYYNSDGYVGNDGIDDDRMLFIPDDNEKEYKDGDYSAKSAGYNKLVTKLLTNLIAKNTGNTQFFQNFLVNLVLSSVVVELPGTYDSLTEMYKEMSQDTGKEDDKDLDSNNKEYGGFFRGNQFIKCAPGPVTEKDNNASITLTGAGNNSTAHSHPSGAKDGQEYVQFPSGKDFRVAPGTTHYAVGMRNQQMYVYTNKGIIGQIQVQTFIGWFYNKYVRYEN